MAEIDEIIEQPSESQQRITKLSSTVKQTAEERDAAKAEAEAANAARVEAEKKAQFAEGFADIVADNPAAKEFKTDIQTKVMSGYSLEDATFAVLGKAGKLNQPQGRVDTFTTSPAGGSATTQIPNQGTEKSVSDMTQEERRAELMGRPDLASILTPRANQ